RRFALLLPSPQRGRGVGGEGAATQYRLTRNGRPGVGQLCTTLPPRSTSTTRLFWQSVNSVCPLLNRSAEVALLAFTSQTIWPARLTSSTRSPSPCGTR